MFNIFVIPLGIALSMLSLGAVAQSPAQVKTNVTTVLSSNACPGCFLKLANLYRSNIPGVQLQEANLLGANLERCQLKGANFHKARLERAKFSNSNLKKSFFNIFLNR